MPLNNSMQMTRNRLVESNVKGLNHLLEYIASALPNKWNTNSHQFFMNRYLGRRTVYRRLIGSDWFTGESRWWIWTLVEKSRTRRNGILQIVVFVLFLERSQAFDTEWKLKPFLKKLDLIPNISQSLNHTSRHILIFCKCQMRSKWLNSNWKQVRTQMWPEIEWNFFVQIRLFRVCLALTQTLCTYPNILWTRSTFVHRLIFPFSRSAASPLDIRLSICCRNMTKEDLAPATDSIFIKSTQKLRRTIRTFLFSENLQIYLCVRNVLVMWLSPSTTDEQAFPSYFMAAAAAVAAAIAALCCSIVPPLSRIRILFRAAIGQPDALKLTKSYPLVS